MAICSERNKPKTTTNDTDFKSQHYWRRIQAMANSVWQRQQATNNLGRSRWSQATLERCFHVSVYSQSLILFSKSNVWKWNQILLLWERSLGMHYILVYHEHTANSCMPHLLLDMIWLFQFLGKKYHSFFNFVTMDSYDPKENLLCNIWCSDSVQSTFCHSTSTTTASILALHLLFLLMYSFAWPFFCYN